jgi:hypothetical protein
MLGAITGAFAVNILLAVTFSIFVLPLVLGFGYLLFDTIRDIIGYSSE